MLKNAHIWSMGAALMRALACSAKLFNTLRETMSISISCDTRMKVQSRSRAMRRRGLDLESKQLFRMEWMREIAVSRKILLKVLTLRGKNSPASATNFELGGITRQGARWPVRCA